MIGSQLELTVAVPEQHSGSVDGVTRQSEYSSLSIFQPHSPSGQSKPLPLPWKSQISVITADKEFIRKRSRHRESINSSLRHFTYPKAPSALGFIQWKEEELQHLPQEKLKKWKEEEASEETLAVWCMQY